MRQRILGFIGVAAVIAAASLVSVAGQAPTTKGQTGTVPKTSWGEPDLQGIWSDEYQIPLQRPAKYAGKEFFTDADLAELNKVRAAMPANETRSVRGTEQDVAGAYNSVFFSRRPTGRRTSLIVDPPDGRIPPVTPEVPKRRAEIREWQLALLEATATCKNKMPGCEGGKYTGVPSPRRFDSFKYYPVGSINRMDNPEDHGLSYRCMSGILPDFGSAIGHFRQIVQSPGSDSRENLHLVERWTRIGPNTIEYVATMEDPTTWTKPWTVKQEMTKQSDEANRIYKEPRCHEGNYGLTGALAGAREKDQAFAEGRGPDPATINTATPTGSANAIAVQAGDEDSDPLQ